MSERRAVIAGHGDYAAGMRSAVEQITGRGDVFVPLSNRGLSAADVGAALGRLLDESGATVIFTDLPAGSCTMAARRLQRERPTLTVVVGANLAALLEFVFTEGELAEVVRNVVEKGRQALTEVTPPGGPARGR
jgi:PTS system N-acetylgalactosamine-specific IIA component